MQNSFNFFFYLQLLAVFMQMGARELLMHYMDLKQTNDVQLTFEALKVNTCLLQLIHHGAKTQGQAL